MVKYLLNEIFINRNLIINVFPAIKVHHLSVIIVICRSHKRNKIQLQKVGNFSKRRYFGNVLLCPVQERAWPRRRGVWISIVHYPCELSAVWVAPVKSRPVRRGLEIEWPGWKSAKCGIVSRAPDSQGNFTLRHCLGSRWIFGTLRLDSGVRTRTPRARNLRSMTRIVEYFTVTKRKMRQSGARRRAQTRERARGKLKQVRSRVGLSSLIYKKIVPKYAL